MSSYTLKRLVRIARGEVGYLEKATNSSLDDKTANAGSSNFTKYARDLYRAGYYNGNKNGYAWCDVFVDWCHFVASGKSKADAEAAECQTGKLGAGCTYSYGYYKDAGRAGSKPKLGAQIFFQNAKGDITHTGIVYAYGPTEVKTVEGNTSSKAGVVANGGCVTEKSYSVKSSRIAGYGYPKYKREPKGTGAYKLSVTKAVRENSKKSSKRVGTAKAGTTVNVCAVRCNEVGNTWGYSDELGGWLYIGSGVHKAQ